MSTISTSDKPASGATSPDISRLERRWYHGLITPTLVATLLAILYWGWHQRDDYLITPEWGIGYWLGIAGGTMFVLIFLYPLRKKWRRLRDWGSVKIWFNVHMLMGMLAPVLIIFHSNFQLGAINSNIALYSMLLVVFSGLIGRYIYAQIHYGLFGSHADLAELTAISEATRGQLSGTFGVAPVLQNILLQFEHRALDKPDTLLQSIGRKLMIGISTWSTYLVLRHRLKSIIATLGHRQGWSKAEQQECYRQTCHTLAIHLAAIRKIAVLNFYERLFAGWHVVHVVFFSLLIFAALFHVLAVHMY